MAQEISGIDAQHHVSRRPSNSHANESYCFPLFGTDLYLSAQTFASRLPAAVKTASQPTVFATRICCPLPGTISLAFADNASNGIEPPFSWSYTRKKRMPSGSFKEYAVEDHAWRLYRHLHGDCPLTPAFVTALEMSAQAREANGRRRGPLH